MCFDKTQLSGLRSQVSGLTRAQIIHLSHLARQAYGVRPIGTPGLDFTTWRHDELDRVVGVRSFKHCRAEDYATLRDHFHRTRLVYLQDAAIAAAPAPV